MLTLINLTLAIKNKQLNFSDLNVLKSTQLIFKPNK